MNTIRLTLIRLFPLWMFTLCVSWPLQGAEVHEIDSQHRYPLQGKEVDWIDGDFVIRNDKVVAVIARPGPNRDANMTVRGVGACLIDFTRLDLQSDQLSCFYPTAGRYQFTDNRLVQSGNLPDGGVYWRCKSSSTLADNATAATIEYQLRDGEPFLTVVTRIDGENAVQVDPVDGVRADRTFRFGSFPGTTVGYCEDEAFRQTYGFQAVMGDSPPQWTSDRMRQLKYPSAASLSDDQRTNTWTTRVFPASCPVDLWGLTQGALPQTIQVRGAVGDQPRIKLSVLKGTLGPLELPAVWRSADDGKSIVHLPAGKYRLRAEAIGHQPSEHEIEVGDYPAEHELQLGPASSVVATVTDTWGDPLPCKATFYGVKTPQGQATADPDFGLDSQSGSVGNCVYSADGSFVRSIPAGTYDVLISLGPEYDVVAKTIEVPVDGEAVIEATLERVVDTTGWVSAELHSHSSPSGDNTSEQLGRVENLLCEHLEFAPCTEHQRIDSYDDQLSLLGARQRMATCSGMELTGQPLPLNHQNAFPLNRRPYAQDGGGPRTDTDPVAQIERLAMWDDQSAKVVQSNHPNMRQMFHDRDLDGKDDGGFSKMLDFMDIIEVHPPEDIFLSDEELAAMKNTDSVRMKPWMELLKAGHRIPGVVNTDAHYNWHGSGWLRNWVRCSTDDPAQIKTEEMIERLEGGQIIVSTGPFMSVQIHHPDLDRPAEIGDTVQIDDHMAEIDIKVQCANWLDVNRVEVFVNGQMQSELSRTRQQHPDAFGDGVVKFDQRLKVNLPQDSFVIVAAIGEKMTLGRVMGSQYGNRPPVVVSNPIFVNVGP